MEGLGIKHIPELELYLSRIPVWMPVNPYLLFDPSYAGAGVGVVVNADDTSYLNILYKKKRYNLSNILGAQLAMDDILQDATNYYYVSVCVQLDEENLNGVLTYFTGELASTPTPPTLENTYVLIQDILVPPVGQSVTIGDVNANNISLTLNRFLVGGVNNKAVEKTAQEVKTILGIRKIISQNTNFSIEATDTGNIVWGAMFMQDIARTAPAAVYAEAVTGELKSVVGAGLVPFYECTVGDSGAMYTTLGAAIAAGCRRILVIGNTTETANFGGYDIQVFIKGKNRDVTINMGDYMFSTILKSTIEDITFSVNPTTANRISIYGSPSAVTFIPTVFNRVDFISVSTSVVHYILNTYSNTMIFNECRFYPSNSDDTCHIINAQYPAYLNNCEIFGGGTSCKLILAGGTINWFIKNLLLSGTFHPLYNVIYWNNAVIHAMRGSENIALTGGNFDALNYSAGGNVSISSTSAYGVVLTNSYIKTLSFGSSATPYPCRISNCIFVDSVTISLPNCQIDNCTFLGGVIITSDNNTLQGCIIGDIRVTGGAETITLNAGADNNILIGNRTDATIVDNGANNQLATNLVF